eukprot:m.171127 g.171127  ORF g.171127 m.171127 type:complete len:415 (+) comp18277_c0_seq18:144-1388(+)
MTDKQPGNCKRTSVVQNIILPDPCEGGACWFGVMGVNKPTAEGGTLQLLKDVVYTAPLTLRHHMASWGVGALIFPGTLYVGHLVMRALSIAAHTPLAPVAGACAAATAGVAASAGYTTTYSLLNNRQSGSRLYSDNGIWHNEDLLVFAASGAIGFWMLGGRFRSLCPSSILHPGAFATDSLPARRFVHATPNQKVEIDAIGAASGCHSCGKRPLLRNLLRRRTRYIADHQPPSKFATAKSVVRFFPHCQRCSSKQGGLASSAKGRWDSTLVLNHPTCIRWAHLWIPLGVLAIAVEDEIWQDVNESSDSAVSRRQPGDGGGGGIDDDDDVAAWDAYRHDHVQLQRRIHALELLVRLDRDAMYVNHRILNRTVISGGIDAESMLIGDCLWLSWTSSKRLVYGRKSDRRQNTTDICM